MNPAQNLAEQSAQPEKPISVHPKSGKELINESTNKARKDVQAILDDSKNNNRPWPKVPENVKNMSLFDLIDRVEALNDQVDLLVWELEQARGEGDGKKRLKIGDKMLDTVRLRRSLGEYIQIHEDLKGKEKDMILIENSPAKSRARAGYVYMGRFKDQEFWIRDESQQQAKKELAA